ncbi:MAG: hypothetical protein IT170_09995 [Bryobacterales bacterium]|nr:hypothetical protein [Bryobacterales bacterium]
MGLANAVRLARRALPRAAGERERGIRKRPPFGFGCAEKGEVPRDGIGVTPHFARADLLEVLAVPVGFALDDLFDPAPADRNGIGFNGIEERGRLTERARRFPKDAHPPAAFDLPGDIPYGIFEYL